MRWISVRGRVSQKIWGEAQKSVDRPERHVYSLPPPMPPTIGGDYLPTWRLWKMFETAGNEGRSDDSEKEGESQVLASRCLTHLARCLRATRHHIITLFPLALMHILSRSIRGPPLLRVLAGLIFNFDRALAAESSYNLECPHGAKCLRGSAEFPMCLSRANADAPSIFDPSPQPDVILCRPLAHHSQTHHPTCSRRHRRKRPVPKTLELRSGIASLLSIWVVKRYRSRTLQLSRASPFRRHVDGGPWSFQEPAQRRRTLLTYLVPVESMFESKPMPYIVVWVARQRYAGISLDSSPARPKRARSQPYSLLPVAQHTTVVLLE
ncbi:hypothetical protein EVG20_g10648 [Dentipellis fragilis]|uniref:Uncharacterized protein n=1 Tax=Dentipellis fragilis TaxID=205917 RepID=A0A4Y9XUJ6_9AGAM|nr:hypothetical protein EVG20_g10648 [Dentipellis fragilis]